MMASRWSFELGRNSRAAGCCSGSQSERQINLQAIRSMDQLFSSGTGTGGWLSAMGTAAGIIFQDLQKMSAGTKCRPLQSSLNRNRASPLPTDFARQPNGGVPTSPAGPLERPVTVLFPWIWTTLLRAHATSSNSCGKATFWARGSLKQLPENLRMGSALSRVVTCFIRERCWIP